MGDSEVSVGEEEFHASSVEVTLCTAGIFTHRKCQRYLLERVAVYWSRWYQDLDIQTLKLSRPVISDVSGTVAERIPVISQLKPSFYDLSNRYIPAFNEFNRQSDCKKAN